MTPLAIVPVMSAVASAAAVQTDAAALLRAAVEAQGSAAAIAAVRSLTVVADCTGPSPDAKFETEVVSLLPDRALFRQNAAGRTMEIVVAGDRGWMRESPTAPARPLPEGLAGVVRGHEFHLMFLELDRRSRNPRLAGRDAVEGRPCLVVAATDPWGHPTSVCIDEKTKLPARLSYEPPGGPKPQTIHVVPSGWTEVAGVRWIDGFTLRQGDEVFTYRYRTIRPNSVDPKIFEIPPDLAPRG